MINPQFDDPLKELEVALAVEPSPAFAARVRMRVAESSHRPIWLGWQGIAAAAVMVLSVLGAVVWQASVGDIRTVLHRTAVEPVGVPVAVTGAPAHVDRAAPVAKTPAIDVPRITSAVAPSPEVLVPPDQGIALNSWLAALRERQASARRSGDASVIVIEEVPKISAVHIEPIRLDPIVTNPPPSGGREKNR